MFSNWIFIGFNLFIYTIWNTLEDKARSIIINRSNQCKFHQKFVPIFSFVFRLYFKLWKIKNDKNRSIDFNSVKMCKLWTCIICSYSNIIYWYALFFPRKKKRLKNRFQNRIFISILFENCKMYYMQWKTLRLHVLRSHLNQKWNSIRNKHFFIANMNIHLTRLYEQILRNFIWIIWIFKIQQIMFM